MKAPTIVAPSMIDTHELKEEVRVLKEALSVMEQQAEEYENQIRSLKDKNPTSRSRLRQSVTPKKPIDIEAAINQLGTGSKSGGTSSRDVLLESISLETALFRPALRSATQSANYWKAKAMESALSKLKPLNVPVKASTMPSFIGDSFTGDLQKREELLRFEEEMALACNELRLVKASVGIVDLSKAKDESAQIQLSKEVQKESAAEARLYNVAKCFSGRDFPPVPLPVAAKHSVGRIEVPCGKGGFVASIAVNKAELRNLHSWLIS
jgi:hypothetical protein